MAGKIQTAQQNAVQNKTEGKSLQQYLSMYQKAFAKALPSMITPERFTRMAMTALTGNTDLNSCTPQSFIGACLTTAQLGLEPNTPLGQAYLIPYKNNKKGITECQFQIGYKGLIDLAYRSGEFSTINAHIVYENDEFDFEYGLDARLKHRPAKSDKGAPIYVYALYKLKNGGYNFEVMSVEEVREYAQRYSKSFRFGPWQSDFEAMAKKTVLKKVLKYAPLKTEVAVAASQDEMKIDVNLDNISTADSLDLAPSIIVDTDTGEVEEATITIDNKDGATE